MRKLTFIVLFLCALSLQAQETERHWYLIPRAGLTFSNLYGDEVDSKMRTGWQVGVDFDAEISDQLGFRAGVNFASVGGKDAANVITYREVDKVKPIKKYGERSNWVMNYITVPLQLEWKPVKPLSLMAGFQFAVRLNAHRMGQQTKGDEDGRESNNFWASIPIGASVDLGRLVIDARYNLGLSAFSDSRGQRLDVISITLGYRLPMGVFKNKKPESKFHLPEIGH